MTLFKVTRHNEEELGEGEILVKSRFYPYNSTTIYSVAFIQRRHYAGYRIFYSVKDIDLNLTKVIWLTTTQGVLKCLF